MIEINLLPPQYRTVERTPLPIFVGVIGSVVALLGLLTYLLLLMSDTDKLNNEVASLRQKKDIKEKEVAEIRKIENEVKESQGRIDTVLSIAESKIYWSQKLDQLARLLPRDVWLDQINYDGGRLQLSCKARGTGLQRYTFLRQKIRNETNFMYHFSDVPLSPIDVVNPGPQYLEPAVLSFNQSLPMKPPEQKR
jgi:Tfp pilus assembly protein PilN